MGSEIALMLPAHILSTTAVPGPFLEPDNLPYDPLVDYELGGVAIRDASQGLLVKTWACRLSGNDVIASAADVADVVLFTRAGITEIAFCFDQNMNPCVTFMQAGVLTLWWFDSSVPGQVFTTYDGITPRVCLDDKRANQTGASDIILTYVRDGQLYFREQRDRFLVEYFLADVTGFTLKKFGMNTVLRLQWQFDPPVVPE